MPPHPLRRVRRFQRVALVLLILSGAINYVDRATLAIGLPLIRQDLGFSLGRSGILLSAFLWAYAFSQMPAGALVDRLGARIMLSAGLGLWSLAQIAGSAVGSFRQFLGARALLGVGESPQFPTCAKIVSDWFQPRERGAATGIWNCSGTLGGAIAAPLLTFLMLHLGWRGMFAATGLAGLAVALAAWCLHRDPRGAALTEAERAHVPESDEGAPAVTWRDLRGLFRFRTTWGMIFGFFGVVYITWLYFSWLPQYLELQWHLSVARTGWIAAIPFACGVGGSLSGGRVCDALLRRGLSPIASRKLPVLAALAVAAMCTVMAAYARSSAFAVVCISLSMFFVYFASSAAWAMVTVAVDGRRVASLGSIQNFGGYVGGALAPIVTGFTVQATGSFRPALLAGGAIAAAAALLHALLVTEPIPKPPTRSEGAA